MEGLSSSSTRSQVPKGHNPTVKILFHQGTLVPLQQHLAGHSVDPVEVIRMALSESRNCELGEFSH